jgi:hypothetical protein
MAESRKILGQSATAATTLTDIYTVPAATQSVVSTITVTNRGNTQTTFRISVAIAGAADDPSQYIYYDVIIAGKDTFATTIGVTLGAADVIRGYAGNANLSFNIFGVEIS